MSWRASSKTFSGGRTLCVITAFMAASCFQASSPIPAATPAAGTSLPAPSPERATPILPTAALAPVPAITPPARSGEAASAIPRIPIPRAAAAAAAADAVLARSAAHPPAAPAAAPAIPAAAMPARAVAAAAAIIPQRNTRRPRAPYIPFRKTEPAGFSGWLYLVKDSSPCYTDRTYDWR